MLSEFDLTIVWRTVLKKNKAGSTIFDKYQIKIISVVLVCMMWVALSFTVSIFQCNTHSLLALCNPIKNKFALTLVRPMFRVAQP